MVKRGELTDEAWARIAPLLPEKGRRGGRWRDHRTVVNGISWKLRTGAPWRDLPARYAPWQTCYDRFVRWRRDDTWDRLLGPHPDQERRGRRGRVGGECGLHGGPGALARCRRPKAAERTGRKKGVEHPQDKALGRSRGG